MKNLPLILLCCLTFTLGCGLSSKLANLTSNTGSSNGTTSGPSTTTASGDPRDDVIQACRKFVALPKFRETIASQGTGANSLNMKLDYVAPDRFHLYFLEPSGNVKTETVMIGKDMYVKAAGRWIKMPGAVADNKIPNMRDFFNEEGIKNLKEVKYEGDDSVDGAPMHIYSYHSDKTAANSAAPYASTAKIWIGSSDGLPKKMEVKYDGGEMNPMSINFDYSSDISIEPPV